VPAGERSPEVAVLTELAKRADLVLANLEGVPADSPPDPANAFDLRFPVERLPILRRAGLTVVGWANNHVADAGLAAIAGGRRALEAADLGVTGAGRDLAEALRPWRAQTTGVRLAVFAACLAGAPAATASAPGVVCLPDHAANLGRAMLEARARREVVLLLLHGGDEYRSAVNEEQGRWARWAVDHGASVVAGSGPHVWQRREFHRGAVVAHSLGNSLCPPRWQGAGSGGWWLLTLDAAGRILHQQTIPAKGPPEANNQAAPTAPGR
jgi:poly-gamma-glutamate synthesis protein (capsule biosynthesis protein)